MCLHVHTACLSSTWLEQPSCKLELGTLVDSVDQGCCTPASGLWAEDFRALDIQNGSSKVEVHCGMLRGPEDFIYRAEKHSLKKAEAAQGRVSFSSGVKMVLLVIKDMSWKANAL